MKAEYGLGYEIHYIPLPSGCCAKIRILLNHDPADVEIHELTGANVNDLEELSQRLLDLARALKYPQGICTLENQK